MRICFAKNWSSSKDSFAFCPIYTYLYECTLSPPIKEHQTTNQHMADVTFFDRRFRSRFCRLRVPTRRVSLKYTPRSQYDGCLKLLIWESVTNVNTKISLCNPAAISSAILAGVSTPYPERSSYNTEPRCCRANNPATCTSLHEAFPRANAASTSILLVDLRAVFCRSR